MRSRGSHTEEQPNRCCSSSTPNGVVPESPAPTGPICQLVRCGTVTKTKGPTGILSLLAGGSASDATRALIAEHGIQGLLSQLEWLDLGKTRLLAHHVTTWEIDPWARGGYAYFGADYDP